MTVDPGESLRVTVACSNEACTEFMAAIEVTPDECARGCHCAACGKQMYYRGPDQGGQNGNDDPEN